MEAIIKTVIGSLTTLIIGYLTGALKKAKQKNKDIEANNNLQNEAIMMLLQNNLTNQFFVHDTVKEIKDYQYRNWLNQLRVYEALGGDDFVHELADRMKSFKIVETDILNNHK